MKKAVERAPKRRQKGRTSTTTPAANRLRAARRHDVSLATDQRSEFERDRDRILYCSAFRRLAGVTQVVGAAEGHIFHNRLTHSMKAAQVARRIAQMLLRDQADEAEELGIDAEVAEAAALAHDLGHPPFGHTGENALSKLVESAGDGDGFEGNAQSFRILTQLAARTDDSPGLNLTRATLNALLKYPWFRAAKGNRSIKFNVYQSEKDDFAFARAGAIDDLRSGEAQIMDCSDDIAYSVHDVEDFYRAGLIPLDRLVLDAEERTRFLSGTQPHWSKSAPELTISDADALLSEITLLVPSPLARPYQATLAQRAGLRAFTSLLIGRYVQSITITDAAVIVDRDIKNEISIMKELMRYYVYCHPALTAQQHGQEAVVKQLFEAFVDSAARNTSPDILPGRFREYLDREKKGPRELAPRVAADIVSTMTEPEAYSMHRRLMGISPGTVRDPILQ